MRSTWFVAPLVLSGLLSFHAVGQATQGQGSSEFAAIDARRNACIARDGSNAHLMACNSVVQALVDARLNSVYQAWVEALKHSKPDEAKDNAEILNRLVAAERAWIDFRDKDCNLQSTSMLNGSGESNVYGDCLYAMTKARVKALEAARSAR
ncbi:MAG: lysozyme inhibitor LprI family protein [Janthinobacterium lividum]